MWWRAAVAAILMLFGVGADRTELQQIFSNGDEILSIGEGNVGETVGRNYAAQVRISNCISVAAFESIADRTDNCRWNMFFAGPTDSRLNIGIASKRNHIDFNFFAGEDGISAVISKLKIRLFDKLVHITVESAVNAARLKKNDGGRLVNADCRSASIIFYPCLEFDSHTMRGEKIKVRRYEKITLQSFKSIDSQGRCAAIVARPVISAALAATAASLAARRINFSCTENKMACPAAMAARMQVSRTIAQSASVPWFGLLSASPLAFA